MADDTEQRGARDRATVAENEPYEVAYFAKKHGITQKETRALIERVGNSRAALDAAVADRPAKRPRRAAAPAAASDKATAPDKSTVKAKARRPAKSVVEAATDAAGALAGQAETAAAAVVEPVTRAVAPVARRAAGARRSVDAAARRGTAAARAATAAAPKTAARRASAAVETAKSAVTGRAASLVGIAAAGLVTGLAMNLGRKAIVQAPSAVAGDWFEALKVEHKLALALFDQLQATDNSAAHRRSVLLIQLKHALGKHAFTEENVVYAALRDWGDKADADKLNHDHGYVKQYLYDLENMDNQSPAFLEKVAAFRTDLEAHIREEEEAVFPPLHAALGAEGNARVTAQANKEGFKLA